MRIAVVVMNLGGPDSPQAVRPFLYNLFSDPAIIRLPLLFRLPLARLIAWRRSATAAAIYTELGGSSPLLANTEAQAAALEQALGPGWRCFVAMRYWRPLSQAVVAGVKAYAPDRIVLLPLYPQFSTTTTASSLAAWQHEATRQGLACPTVTIREYPTEPGFIEALAGRIVPVLREARRKADRVRLLFSAHGLPLKIVQAGDPYPQQVRHTAEAVAAALAESGLDWAVCYQSRVGPLAWLRPSVPDELDRAARDGAAVIVVPISFVSEHSETLVELDREYRGLAEQRGVPGYWRVATVGTDPAFIAGLASLVAGALSQTGDRSALALRTGTDP